MNSARSLFLISVLAALALILGLGIKPRSSAGRAGGKPLLVYCAAGIKPPMEAAARLYEREFSVPVQLQYGGSGTLLSSLRISGRGDLFLAADESYLRQAQKTGLVEEIIPLATMRPVIAVKKGNPKGIQTLSDLTRAEIALANPEAAAIGKITQDLLQSRGNWESLAERARVFKPTVNDVANDIKLGTVDAGIVWDATVRQYPDLEMITVPELAGGEQKISIGVLRSSEQPSQALRFARYLGAVDKGLREFARAGYQPIEGDAWAETPEIVLFSGGVNRIAIEDTLQQFERREGARVVRVYNGCGILVSEIKSGQHPDAYFACDTSFMRQVSALFPNQVSLSKTDMILLLPKGNPKSIHDVVELVRPGLKLGIANEQQSALGALTASLLKSLGLYDQVMANVRVQTPTADLLVNQMKAGSLDAVIVYAANTSQVRDQFEIRPIKQPNATAVQPFAIAKDSKHRLLSERLLAALRSPASRQRFESVGFRWVSAEP